MKLQHIHDGMSCADTVAASIATKAMWRVIVLGFFKIEESFFWGKYKVFCLWSYVGFVERNKGGERGKSKEI